MNDYIRQIGHDFDDIDEVTIRIGVDYDSVTISRGTWVGIRLNQDQAEQFAHCFVAACWQAGRNAERMSAEAVTDADPE